MIAAEARVYGWFQRRRTTQMNGGPTALGESDSPVLVHGARQREKEGASGPVTPWNSSGRERGPGRIRPRDRRRTVSGTVPSLVGAWGAPRGSRRTGEAGGRDGRGRTESQPRPRSGSGRRLRGSARESWPRRPGWSPPRAPGSRPSWRDDKTAPGSAPGDQSAGPTAGPGMGGLGSTLTLISPGGTPLAVSDPRSDRTTSTIRR